MTKLNTVSIAIANEIYGFGHLKRMVVLNNYLNKNNINNDIICFTNTRKKLKKNIFKINCASINNLVSIIENKTVFFDISNSKFLSTKIYRDLIIKLKRTKFRPIFFDSLDKNMLNSINYLDRNNIVISPYFLKKIDYKYYQNTNFFIGPEYFLSNKIYKNTNQKKILKKIFISCGGLDKTNKTSQIAKTICEEDNNFEISIIIGPYFSKKNIERVNNLKKYHKIKIYKNINNITKISKLCDLAIVSSGLTKYEMLFSKINLAVFCEDKNQLKINKYFMKKKFSYDLSTFKNNIELKKKIKKLFVNYIKIYKEINHNREKKYNMTFKFNKIIDSLKKLN